MLEPELVAECVAAMRAAVDIPITVKCRTGVDADDDYDFLARFVDIVAGAGCNTFIVHARKAILTGLSPAQNRTIPPLDWTRVSRLKADFPDLTLVVNGGIETLDVVRAQLQCVDGVMLGRAAYHNPWILTELERRAVRHHAAVRRAEALDAAAALRSVGTRSRLAFTRRCAAPAWIVQWSARARGAIDVTCRSTRIAPAPASTC